MRRLRGQRSGSGRLYNILLPLWMLVWFPSLLWLLVIPANYLVDRLVLRWSLPADDARGPFCRAHTWKVCLAGFASDFVGSCLLLGVAILLDRFEGDWAYEAAFGIEYNAFSNPVAFLVTCVAIALSGLCIYLLDLRILRGTGLQPEQAKASALKLAVLTAPYLFLFPSALLYR